MFTDKKTQINGNKQVNIREFAEIRSETRRSYKQEVNFRVKSESSINKHRKRSFIKGSMKTESMIFFLLSSSPLTQSLAKRTTTTTTTSYRIQRNRDSD